jgi:hypothetical protein
MHDSDWISTGGDYPKGLPRLAFPLDGAMPDLYAPQSTILQTADGIQTHAYLWCYLDRKIHGRRYLFNVSSLSSKRVEDLPRAIERLSKRFRFDNARPRTVNGELANGMSRFLNWLDDPVHEGRFESVLSDPDLALEAIQRHHSYLRQRMQANHPGKRISASTASTLDLDTVKMMSVIHGREYSNEIEVIKYIHGDGIKAPETEAVAGLMACVQGVFDSVVRIVFDNQRDIDDSAPLGELRWQSGAQQGSVPIATGTNIERLIELGCIAYAALCIGDSAANLAPIQSYEEPEDMDGQLESPERLTLRHKVIKFRAGRKEVPVHLTSTTVTRLRSYLRLREALRQRFDSTEIVPMFVQCKYDPASVHAKPLGVTPLPHTFTSSLRGRFGYFGIRLPLVTMQQLRAYKSGRVAKEHNPEVAAAMLGHSVSTAIRKYIKITDAEARSEMAPFLASLTSVVLTRSEAGGNSPTRVIPITAIPTGSCEDHGHPEAMTDNSPVRPDCKKTEGCFFCNKFHVHAEDDDCIKLMSCRSVLERVAPKFDDSGAAELVYAVVIDRIGALLNEIKRINPDAHERARVVVLEEGRLSRYWASKLQQLHLLGLLAPHSAVA